MILYFPSEGGLETKPTGEIFQHPVLDRGGLGSQSASRGKRKFRSRLKSQSIEESSDEEDEDDELFQDIEDLTADTDENDSIPPFRVYWQNRLVPQTTLDKLSFFPEAKTMEQCDRIGIPRKWSSRIKCFLFFDANFHNISNNKLRLTVDPNLQSWIMERSVVKDTTIVPKNVKDLFLRCVITCELYCLHHNSNFFVYCEICRWLKSCNDRFDQEFTYSHRDDAQPDVTEHVKQICLRESVTQ